MAAQSNDPGIVLDEQLLLSWELTLRAANKSERTITIYLNQARYFMAWCDSLGVEPRFDRLAVQTYLAAELDRGCAGNTVRTRYRGLRQLANWLFAEGETDTMVMTGVAQPQAQVTPPPILSEEETAAIVKACEGPRYIDRRDMAMLRLLMDTGARASEIVNLKMGDIDLREGVATVTGKGNRVRLVPFGPTTARMVDKYLRARRQHRLAGTTDRLWIGERGPMTYDGLADAMGERAKAAGVVGFHPHRLRHTLAHRWMAAGGSETGLMDVAGWKSREMLDRYGASARAERALAEAKRLGLNQ